MSEGERVVFERLPEGTPNDNPEHYTEEDGCFNPCPGCDPENVSGVYRRIPDPVPGLQAEIERLKVDARDSDILFGRGWQKTLASVGRDFSQFDQAQRLELAAKNEELEARIAELEGIFKNLSLLVSDGKGFEVEAHPGGATILLTEHDGATTYEMETQRSVFDALVWAADFAAAAKEQ